MVATSNPTIRKILQHSRENTTFAQMRHIGMPGSNLNSETKKSASGGMAISSSPHNSSFQLFNLIPLIMHQLLHPHGRLILPGVRDKND